jgi:hypothetical protein
VDGGVLAGRFLVREPASKEAGDRCERRPWKRLRRSTFQVNTIVVKAAGGSVSNRAHAFARTHKSGTSSNVVISREKVLIQLESLILAQSERWRQA